MKGICGGRGKKHALSLITETTLNCVANKPE